MKIVTCYSGMEDVVGKEVNGDRQITFEDQIIVAELVRGKINPDFIGEAPSSMFQEDPCYFEAPENTISCYGAAYISTWTVEEGQVCPEKQIERIPSIGTIAGNELECAVTARGEILRTKIGRITIVKLN